MEKLAQFTTNEGGPATERWLEGKIRSDFNKFRAATHDPLSVKMRVG